MADNNPPPADYYQLQYDDTTYHTHTRTTSLAELRRLFNKHAAHVTPAVVIPSAFRVWLRWSDRWVELIDDESLQAALQDVHYIHARATHTAAAASATDGWCIELLFRPENASSPNTSPPRAMRRSPERQQQQQCVSTHTDALAELKTDESLYERVQFLVADMLKLKDDDRWIWDVLHPRSLDQSELDQAAYFSSLYLPSLYFSRAEQLRLSQFPTATGVALADAITNTVGRKFSELSGSASATGAHVCSSHDLAPLLRRVFKLDHTFYKSASFINRHAEFERKLKKTMKKAMQQEEVGHQGVTSAVAQLVGITASSVASSSPLVDPISSLPADTPQLLKLRALQAEFAELSLSGHTDAKLSKQIHTLEKEVTRMAKKK